MPDRLTQLRYPSKCRSCEEPLPARSRAYYDHESKTVSCQPCLERESPDLEEGAAVSPIQSFDTGVAGAGPQREYERRRAKHDHRIEQRWGRFAPVAKLLSSEPQHTTAFSKGAEGERRLAALLEREVGGCAVFLHSRRIKNGDIDHLAVGASGVFVIDAKNYVGKVEARDVGNWRTIDRRLFVGGRDKSALVDGMSKQVDAVQHALSADRFADTPIHPVLCFTNSEWGFFAKPLLFGPVTCTWGQKLCEIIRQPGPLDDEHRRSIAAVLGARLPAAG